MKINSWRFLKVKESVSQSVRYKTSLLKINAVCGCALLSTGERLSMYARYGLRDGSVIYYLHWILCALSRCCIVVVRENYSSLCEKGSQKAVATYFDNQMDFLMSNCKIPAYIHHIFAGKHSVCSNNHQHSAGQTFQLDINFEYI